MTAHCFISKDADQIWKDRVATCIGNTHFSRDVGLDKTYSVSSSYPFVFLISGSGLECRVFQARIVLVAESMHRYGHSIGPILL
jgi:hypothetical protein